MEECCRSKGDYQALSRDLSSHHAITFDISKARKLTSKIHQATIGNLSEILQTDAPVVIDFWANWCGPCHALTPIMKKLAREFEGRISFAKVNVGTNRDLASQFQVRSLPTVVLFKHGREWDRFSGVRSHADMRKLLEKLVK
jgi:thioredoxin